MSAILERCHSSSLDAAALLQQIEDEEDQQDQDQDIAHLLLPPQSAAVDQSNECLDENIDDEFLDEDHFTQQQQQQQQHHLQQQQYHHAVEKTSGLQHMRELKRRHASHARYATSQSSARQESSSSAVVVTEALHMPAPSFHHDEFVLKCQFSALIPAFDPRPGKSNINQIQDIAVPVTTTTTTATATSSNAAPKPTPFAEGVESGSGIEPKVELYLRAQASNGSPLEFVKSETRLANKNATIFQYIQSLIELNGGGGGEASALHYDKMKSVWDVNYSLVYRESPLGGGSDETEKK